MAVVGKQVEQQVAQEIAQQPNLPEWVGWITYFVKEEPTVLVVILLLVAIGWLVTGRDNLGKIIARKDDTISRLTHTLVELHREGTVLDSDTKIMVGLAEERRRKNR